MQPYQCKQGKCIEANSGVSKDQCGLACDPGSVSHVLVRQQTPRVDDRSDTKLVEEFPKTSIGIAIAAISAIVIAAAARVTRHRAAASMEQPFLLE